MKDASVAEVRTQFGLGDFDLIAGGEGFDGEDVGGGFVFAEEDDVAG